MFYYIYKGMSTIFNYYDTNIYAISYFKIVFIEEIINKFYTFYFSLISYCSSITVCTITITTILMWFVMETGYIWTIIFLIAYAYHSISISAYFSSISSILTSMSSEISHSLGLILSPSNRPSPILYCSLLSSSFNAVYSDISF